MRADTIDDFQLTDKQFLRYGLWRPPRPSGLGTVLVLGDYGGRIEDVDNVAASLVARGFYVATFEWFARSAPTAHSSAVLPAPLADFRLSLQHLREIFFNQFLALLPAPFYGFGVGLGALFGLAAQPYLRSQMRRMVLVSPLLAPHRHIAGGLFHRYSRFMCDLGLAGWRTNQQIAPSHPHLDPLNFTGQNGAGYPASLCPTLGCYQGMLDAAQWLLSPAAPEQHSIPFLCILSDKDSSSHPDQARKICERLRSGEVLTLRQVGRLPFEGDTAPGRQFWCAFDNFIPGSGAPHPERSLEDGLVM